MKEILTTLQAKGIDIKPTTIQGIARKLRAPLTHWMGRDAIICYVVRNADHYQR
jgi:hypothetical protein